MRYSKYGIDRSFERIRQMAARWVHGSDSPPTNYNCDDCLEYDTILRRCRYRVCLKLIPDTGTDDIDENCPNCMHYDPVKRVCEPGNCLYLSDEVLIYEREPNPDLPFRSSDFTPHRPKRKYAGQR